MLQDGNLDLDDLTELEDRTPFVLE